MARIITCFALLWIITVGIQMVLLRSLYRNMSLSDEIEMKSMLPANMPHKKHAIAYLMAGCEASPQSSCVGYIMNVLAAKSLLDEHGFGGELVTMIRMTSSSTPKKLAQDEWLRRAGVKVQYLPSLPVDNFALAQLDKFRTLQMLEYDRVLYLDADAIPLCNLDYVFDASYRGYLSEYVAMGQYVSPATGSIFLVTPKEGAFQQVMSIVRERLDKGGFNQVDGWGHVISEPDFWKSMLERGRNWTFYGAHADQGLLYHWIKYVNKNWTLLFREYVETWRQVDDGYDSESYALEDGTRIAMVNRSKDFNFGCNSPRYDRAPWAKYHLYADHYHFAGLRKPWFHPKPTNDTGTVEDLWWHWLSRANATWNLQLPSVLNISKPSLGGRPKKNDLVTPGLELPKRI